MCNVLWTQQQQVNGSCIKILQVAYTSGGITLVLVFSICPQVQVKIEFELLLDKFVLEYHSLVEYWAPAFDTDKARRIILGSGVPRLGEPLTY